MEIGQRVRVCKKHWARSGQIGTVEETDLENGDFVIVNFERKGIGYGDGHFLRLNVADLSDVS